MSRPYFVGKVYMPTLLVCVYFSIGFRALSHDTCDFALINSIKNRPSTFIKPFGHESNTRYLARSIRESSINLLSQINTSFGHTIARFWIQSNSDQQSNDEKQRQHETNLATRETFVKGQRLICLIIESVCVNQDARQEGFICQHYQKKKRLRLLEHQQIRDLQQAIVLHYVVTNKFSQSLFQVSMNTVVDARALGAWPCDYSRGDIVRIERFLGLSSTSKFSFGVLYIWSFSPSTMEYMSFQLDQFWDIHANRLVHVYLERGFNKRWMGPVSKNNYLSRRQYTCCGSNTYEITISKSRTVSIYHNLSRIDVTSF